jgi:hypothetical protein
MRLRCVDGDPECDDDDVPGQCTFGIAICLGGDDPRLPKCKQLTLKRLVVKTPNPKRVKNDVNSANAGVLEAAIEALGSSEPGPQGCARAPTVRCSAMLPIVVPTRGQRTGSKRLKVVGVSDEGRRGRAKLKLFCKPAKE